MAKTETCVSAIVNGLPRLHLPEVIRGVYFLMFRGVVVYVGQSSDIVSRIYSHYSEWCKRFDDVRYLQTDDKRLANDVELELIRTLKPKYNSQRHPKGGRGVWIRPILGAGADSDSLNHFRRF
ncbi:MAG: hypothetical protein PHU85_10650 [Phycisphaerae bacterium]|nr:hypothetical protein [Phycisphaerae bacterium]